MKVTLKLQKLHLINFRKGRLKTVRFTFKYRGPLRFAHANMVYPLCLKISMGKCFEDVNINV